MWLVTTFGYFSIVQKKTDKGAGTLTVRARVRRDLETLKQKYLPTLGEIDDTGGADYPYRAKAKREDIARAFAKAMMDIRYSNFKAEVAYQMGPKREQICTEVWMALRKFQTLDGEPPRPPVQTSKPAAKAQPQ